MIATFNCLSNPGVAVWNRLVTSVSFVIRNVSMGAQCRWPWNAGDILVTRDHIMNNRFRTVRVLIHEATHKFAQTDDFDEQGYMWSAGSDFRAPGIPSARCLNNADSYAYFCMAGGHRA
jgi:hypothetical protein